MSSITSTIRRFLKDESGATMVEYGIMVAVIAAVSIAIIQSIGSKTTAAFKNVDGAMP
jgi:pilus assembly protein Flp/PilA